MGFEALLWKKSVCVSPHMSCFLRSLYMQRAAAIDWVHRPEDFDAVLALLRSAVPLFQESQSALAAVEFRDFELLRYGEGAFFAEHADRCAVSATVCLSSDRSHREACGVHELVVACSVWCSRALSGGCVH